MSELGLRSTACQVPICSLRSYWDQQFKVVLRTLVSFLAIFFALTTDNLKLCYRDV